jgi:hypothetical protein
MPLHIKQSLSKQPTFIILPFVKDKVDFELIKEITGLNYNPDITFGPKDVHTFYHPEKQLKVIILGLGETKDASKADFYFRSIIFQQRSKTALHIEVVCEHLSDEYLSNAIIGVKKGLVNHGIFKTNGNKFAEPSITIIASKKKKKYS